MVFAAFHQDRTWRVSTKGVGDGHCRICQTVCRADGGRKPSQGIVTICRSRCTGCPIGLGYAHHLAPGIVKLLLRAYFKRGAHGIAHQFRENMVLGVVGNGVDHAFCACGCFKIAIVVVGHINILISGFSIKPFFYPGRISFVSYDSSRGDIVVIDPFFRKRDIGFFASITDELLMIRSYEVGITAMGKVEIFCYFVSIYIIITVLLDYDDFAEIPVWVVRGGIIGWGVKDIDIIKILSCAGSVHTSIGLGNRPLQVREKDTDCQFFRVPWRRYLRKGFVGVSLTCYCPHRPAP